MRVPLLRSLIVSWIAIVLGAQVALAAKPTKVKDCTQLLQVETSGGALVPVNISEERANQIRSLQHQFPRLKLTKEEVSALLADFVKTGAVAGDLHYFAYLRNSGAEPHRSLSTKIHHWGDHESFSVYKPARFKKESLLALYEELSANTEASRKKANGLADRMTNELVRAVNSHDVDNLFNPVDIAMSLSAPVGKRLNKLKEILDRPNAHEVLRAIYRHTILQIAEASHRRSGGLVERTLGRALDTTQYAAGTVAAYGGGLCWIPLLFMEYNIISAAAISAGLMFGGTFTMVTEDAQYGRRFVSIPRNLVCSLRDRGIIREVLQIPHVRTESNNYKKLLEDYQMFSQRLRYEVSKRFTTMTREFAVPGGLELSLKDVQSLADENIFLSKISATLLRDQLAYVREMNSILPGFIRKNFKQMKTYDAAEAERHWQMGVKLREKFQLMRVDAEAVLSELKAQLEYTQLLKEYAESQLSNQAISEIRQLQVAEQQIFTTYERIKARIEAELYPQVEKLEQAFRDSQVE